MLSFLRRGMKISLYYCKVIAKFPLQKFLLFILTVIFCIWLLNRGNFISTECIPMTSKCISTAHIEFGRNKHFRYFKINQDDIDYQVALHNEKAYKETKEILNRSDSVRIYYEDIEKTWIISYFEWKVLGFIRTEVISPCQEVLKDVGINCSLHHDNYVLIATILFCVIWFLYIKNYLNIKIKSITRIRALT